MSKSYGVNDLRIAKEFLAKGKAIVDEQRHEEEKAKLQEAVDVDNKMYYDAFAKSKITGKDKYIKNLRAQCNVLEKQINLEKSLNDYNGLMTTYSSPKHDSALLGGIASGIAGPAAGVAAALNAENNNRNNAMHDANIREMAASNYEQMHSMISNHRQELFMEQLHVEEVENKLIDDTNLKDKFLNLTFENVHYEITEGNNLTFICNVKVKPDLLLLGKPAILDGTLKIKLLDTNGNLVGETYYSAPGFDEWDMTKVGFEIEKEIRSICLINNKSILDNLDLIQSEILPLNLWLIEGEED